MTDRSVLVVDDDRDIREVLVEMLELEGFEVSTATNGRQALERLGSGRFAALVTDLMMPVMDGWSLVAEVRRQAARAAFPIVVITAHASVVPGADRVLHKPFDIADLVSALRTTMARAATGGAQPIGPALGPALQAVPAH